MSEVAQKINNITPQEKSFLAFSIQDSFSSYDKDLSTSQKNDLDKRFESHIAKTDKSFIFKVFLSDLLSKYAR